MSTTETIDRAINEHTNLPRNKIDILSLAGSIICLKAYNEEELDKMAANIIQSCNLEVLVISSLSDFEAALINKIKVFLLKTPTNWDHWNEIYLDRIDDEDSVVFILDYAPNINDARILFNISDWLGKLDEYENLILEEIDIF